MRNILMLTMLVISYGAWAQKTKKITNKNESPPYEEVYYVLAGQKSIKQGSYVLECPRFSVKGQYDKNVRTGEWIFLNEQGELEQKIDFSADTVLIAKPFLLKDYWIASDSINHSKPDRAPLLLGGMPRYAYYLNSLLRYPKEAYFANLMGKVLVSAIITTEGIMKDEKVVSGPADVLNAEGLRVVKTLPDEWLPGKVKGKPVDTMVIIVITFKLEK